MQAYLLDVSLPWVAEDSADAALEQALTFLEELKRSQVEPARAESPPGFKAKTLCRPKRAIVLPIAIPVVDGSNVCYRTHVINASRRRVFDGSLSTRHARKSWIARGEVRMSPVHRCAPWEFAPSTGYVDRFSVERQPHIVCRSCVRAQTLHSSTVLRRHIVRRGEAHVFFQAPNPGR
jgi:hypothetical protein